MSSKSKKSSPAYSVKTDSSPAETIKTESSLRDKLDSLSSKSSSKTTSANMSSNKSKKTWMGLEWQTPKFSSKSSLSTSPNLSGQKLHNDILYLIADKLSPDTKRTLKETSKLFKDIKVSPTYGRKIGDEILAYLRKDKNLRRENTLYLNSHEYPDDSLQIITEPQRNGNGKQLLIIRYRKK